MAQQNSFERPARTALVRIVLAALLATALACQSDADDGGSNDGSIENPAAPGSNAASTSAGGSVTPAQIDARPEAADEAAADPAGDDDSETPDEPAAANGAGESPAVSAGLGGDGEASTALTFGACTAVVGTYANTCDVIYVTVAQSTAPRCVQLTIDNCGDYGRQGLPVDVPTSWRLASGSIGADADDCELGTFYPDRSVVGDASGSIEFNIVSRRPTDLVLDLTLSPLGGGGDGANVDIATTEPLAPAACPE